MGEKEKRKSDVCMMLVKIKRKKIALSFDDGNHTVNAKVIYWWFLEGTRHESF